MRLNALFRLAFATAPPHGLILPHTITRRLILQKARGHFTSARRLTALPRLVGTRFQVLFHDPSPGHFSPFPHGTGPLSVTREYLALEGGPPRFSPRFTGADLLRNVHREAERFRLRDDCPLWCAVPRASTIDLLGNSRRETHLSDRRPTTPGRQRVRAYTGPVWADPLSLATTRGVSVDFLSSGY